MQDTRKLEYNRQTNQLKLIDGNDSLLEAAFNYDLPDRTALLSFPEGADLDSEQVKFVCDEAAKHVSIDGNCKLYVTVGDDSATLVHKDEEYRNEKIDRLWILKDAEKERKIVSSNFDELDRDNLKVVTDKTEIKKYVKQIGQMLQKNTYWHEEGCDETKALSIIESASTAFLLMHKGQPIGFRRMLSNGKVSYLSDFVIDKPFVGKGYATFLTEFIYNNFLRETPLTILVAARGSEEAPVIAKKAGFEPSNEKNHAFGQGGNLYFKYCRENKGVVSKFMQEDQKAREKTTNQEEKVQLVME